MHLIRAAMAGLALFVLSAMTALPATAQTTGECDPEQTAGYAPDECSLTTTTSEVGPGGTLTISGTGFVPGSEVRLALIGSEGSSISLGTVVADGEGAFSKEVTIPDSVLAGQYTVTATGLDPSGNERVLSIAITVVGGAPPAAGAPPSRGGIRSAVTGWDPLPWAVSGIALAVFGAGVVVLAGRRRPTTEPEPR